MTFVHVTQMKLGRRLGISFGALIGWIILLGVVSWWSLSKVNTAMDVALEQNERTRTAMAVTKDIDDITMAVWNIVAHEDESERRSHLTELKRSREAYRARLDELKTKATTETGQQLLAKIEEAVNHNRDVNDKALAIIEAKGKREEAIRMVASQGQDANVEVDEQIAAFVEWRLKRAKDADDQAEGAFARAKLLLELLVAMAIATAIGFGVVVARSITAPIAQSVAYLTRLSQGDLSTDVATGLRSRPDEAGELGRALQATTDSMREAFGRLADGVETLTSAATQLSAVSGQSSSEGGLSFTGPEPSSSNSTWRVAAQLGIMATGLPAAWVG